MRAVGLLLCVAACYKPVPPEGRPCSDLETCPTGLACFGGFCLSQAPDGGEGIEAPPPDALPDGPPLPDADPNCHCVGGGLECGGGAPSSCPLGCSEPPDQSGGHCLAMVPSNDVDAAFVTEVTVSSAISGAANFDTDTGAITGSLTRAAGEGVVANIGFHLAASGAPLGIFVFAKLDIVSSATVTFTGSRAAVFLVATDAQIDGTIDGSAGCSTGDASCGGPGGGTGGTAAGPATGCGPGGDGGTGGVSGSQDAGGGGGGGGLIGGIGGLGDTVIAPAGLAGVACLSANLEPLAGGSGGGTGGPGNATRAAGGGGGGALQISAMTSLTVTGTIDMAGAGGSGGPAAMNNAGAGAGGGAGGGILLESPTLTLGLAVVLTCNGGAGGSAAQGMTAGISGANGGTGTAGAKGGNQIGAQAGRGGDGGAQVEAAQAGKDSANGGGGGGAVGAVHLRATTPPIVGSGTFSPAPSTRAITTM